MCAPVRDLVLLALTSSTAAAGADVLLAPASGGAFTVDSGGEEMLRSVPEDLSDSVLTLRERGEAFFNTPFVPAPSPAKLRDGLGPLFNSVSCESCHNNLGRGRPVDAGGSPSVSLVLQLSIPNTDGTWVEHPRYGNSINPQGVPGVPAEGQVRVTYASVTGAYADGTGWALQRPAYEVEDLAYGPVGDAAISPRMAQPLIGLGLLEAIPEDAILALADADDRDGDGISGRPNEVPTGNGKPGLGRFGWKAGQADVRAQIRVALLDEQGISSDGSAPSNCAPLQVECLAAADGGKPEINAADFDSIVTFMRTVPVPARQSLDDAIAKRGAGLFLEANCDACHTPAWTTGSVSDIPALSKQRIYPFTDLLLHDMGPQLADGRPERSATGSEWRTPPLWGIGRVVELGMPRNFLHDGRARTLEEAVLWHGGEAKGSRSAFLHWTRDERDALVAFLRSL